MIAAIMGTFAPLSLALRLLPGPVLRDLDAWSYRRALRKQLARQRKWLARNAAPLAETQLNYKLKPWRD